MAGGNKGNKPWLRQQLQRLLQWDADAAEALVEAIAAAGSSQAEVEALAEAYTGGNAAAMRMVRQYAGFPPQQAGQRGAADRVPGAGAGGPGAPASVELPPPQDKPKPVIDLGPNIRTIVKPARKKAAAAGAAARGGGGAAPQAGADRALAKPVVNCLGCGKVYDCRAPSEGARRFLDSGGICTFCGRRVALQYADGGTNEAPAGAPLDAGPAGKVPNGEANNGANDGELAGFKPEAQQGNAAASVSYNDSAAAAAALRDRLVQYDRESARRTTVLDDQEDYYAFLDIDANPWLTDEERAVLKQREREAQEAEEARRRRVVISFDLLGRKVLMHEPGADGEGGQADAAALQAQLDAARAVADARAAAAATEAEAAQGGGGAAPTALAAVEERLRDLRITVAPSFASRHLVFLPQQAQQQARQPAQAQREGQQAAGPSQAEAPQQAAVRQRQRQRQQPRQAQGRQGRQPRISRLQHDDPFDLSLQAAGEAAVTGT